MSEIIVKAFAKINLTLRVLGVREDGYHTLRTVFQSLALHDTLTCQRTSGAFRIACADPACPTDRSNLVWRAAEAVWQAAGRRGQPRDAIVAIAKRIPLQSGLGGGSSDAAAAIRGLAALWRVQLSRERQHAMAAGLGADVPFFLEGGTSLGLDRGDVLFPLADPPTVWVTLAVPPFGVSTKEAYEWFDRDHSPDAGRGPSAAKFLRACSHSCGERCDFCRRVNSRTTFSVRFRIIIRKSGVSSPVCGDSAPCTRRCREAGRRCSGSSRRGPGPRPRRASSLDLVAGRSSLERSTVNGSPMGPAHAGASVLCVSDRPTCRQNSPSYTLSVCAARFGPLLRSASQSVDRCDAQSMYDRCEYDGAWPSGKARDFGSRIRRFESFRPSQLEGCGQRRDDG